MALLIYIIKTTISLGVLLLVYKMFLENEKMHHFNRVYLLVAIAFSLMIPFLPGAMAIEWGSGTQNTADEFVPNVIVSNASHSEQFVQRIDWQIGLLWGYCSVLIVLLVRFGTNILRLVRLSQTNKKSESKGSVFVLLEKNKLPFTFLNKIFVNKKEFENGLLDRKLIDHELAHARQRHSYDVLFIEFLMVVFWFNPLLYVYKQAIQLNHEFLADDKVIKKYNELKKYQYLLLDTIQNNNKIYLASNINFHLTQKRLNMMTRTSSARKKGMLMLGTVPVLIGLLLCLGKPAISQSTKTPSAMETRKKGDTIKDKYFEHAMIQYKSENGQIKVIKYTHLNEKVKARLAVPPPPPNGYKELKPLAKSTLVYLSENGSVRIGSFADSEIPVPPPPPPPPPVAAPSKAGKAVAPPRPPKPPRPVAPEVGKSGEKGNHTMAPPPPPPPPPPLTNADVSAFTRDQDTEIYIDGKLVMNTVAEKMLKDNFDTIESIDVIKGKGKKTKLIVKMK